MQYTTKLMGLAMLATSQFLSVAGSALPADDVFNDYEIVTPTFLGTINGQDYELTGTLQDVHAQLEALHPDYDFDAAAALAGVPSIERRAIQSKNGLICIPVPGQSWNFCSEGNINNGINSLIRNGGRIGLNARQCARIWCTGAAAIFVCNDNGNRIDPALSYLASYARDISNRCILRPPGGEGIVGGQEFDSDHYNVIVHSDRC